MTRKHFESLRSKCRFSWITDKDVHHDKESQELSRQQHMEEFRSTL